MTTRIYFDPAQDLKLTRAERRQFRKNVALIDLISEADAKFFQRFPQRRFRLRVAGRVEIRQQELIHGSPLQNCDFGEAPFVLVQNIVPGNRLKVFVIMREDSETDLSDDEAGQLWAQATALAPDNQKQKAEIAMRGLAEGE